MDNLLNLEKHEFDLAIEKIRDLLKERFVIAYIKEDLAEMYIGGDLSDRDQIYLIQSLEDMRLGLFDDV